MVQTSWWWRAAAVALGINAACGGSSGVVQSPRLDDGPAPDASFPSAEELRGIAGQPVNRAAIVPVGVLVDEWELAGPFPAEPGVTPLAPATVWERWLADAATEKGAVATEQMTCVARETGRFVLAHGDQPAAALRRFIASRCGALPIHVAASSTGTDVPAEASEDEIAVAWEQAVKEGLARLTEPDAELGVWFGREGERALLVVVRARPELRVTAAPRVPDEHGRLVIEGELSTTARELTALINVGQLGFRRCDLDPLVRAPRFRAVCVPDPGDEHAWIELAAYPPDRALGRTVLELLTWPAGTPPTTYRRYTFVQTGGEPDVLAQVNAVRRAAGLEPLVIATAQTATAAALAWHYFAAQAEGRNDVTDRIALGLLAGWQVDAPVRAGWFSSELLVGTTSVDAMLENVLARPAGRFLLLQPEARYAALAVVTDGERGMVGALMATYATSEVFDRAAAAGEVVARLTAMRAARGLPATQVIPGAQAILDRAAARVHAGETTPAAALDDAMAAIAGRGSARVRGWVLEAGTVADARLPAELLGTTDVAIAVSVAVHRDASHPWSRYAVLVVAAEPTAAPEVQMPPLVKP